MSEETKQALVKIEEEVATFSGGQKEKAVYKYVAETLKKFCQNEQFAQAVLGTEQTLTDCCKEIMKEVGGSIPDIEVYRNATEFYFPHAVVDFTMNITIGRDTLAVGEPVVEEGEHPRRTPPNTAKKIRKPAETTQKVSPKNQEIQKNQKTTKEEFIQISLF